MKFKIILVLICVMLTTVSCVVDVPDMDDTQPPQFSFTVKGDGFSHTFTQDDDFSSFQLNLKEYKTYEFTFSGYDDGGLKNLIWTFPGNLNDFRTILLSLDGSVGWRVTNRYDSASDGLRFDGDIENPINATMIEGEFYSYSSFGVYYFDFSAMDYGGMNGDENMSQGRLNIIFVDDSQPTELILRNSVE